MGTRGPKPSGKVVVNTKIEPQTRDALHAAAAQSGRTLSSEIEYRLRRSFEDDAKISETLGGWKMFAMLRAIAATMNFAATVHSPLPYPGNGPADWLDDPDAYDRALWAAVATLHANRPSGEAAAGEDWEQRRKRYGEGAAHLILEEISNAPPVLAAPGEPISPAQRLYRRIASDLGRTSKEDK